MTANAILQQALKLPRNQRVRIAEELLDSAYDREILIAGAKVADARWKAYQRGEIGAKPAREALQALRARKRKKP